MAHLLLSLILSFAYAQNKPTAQAKPAPVAQPAPTVLATVGNTKIMSDDFLRRYKDVLSKAQYNIPTREQFLEDLVRYELGVQQAQKENLQNDPIYKERMRQEIYKLLLEKHLTPPIEKVHLSDKELREYYEKNPQLRFSHILIEFKPGATVKEKEAAKRRANEIYDEVRKSKRPFEELVRLYSDDLLSKNTNGDLGYHNRVTLGKEYYETLLKMKVGEIRGLIELPQGFAIAKLTEKRSYDTADPLQVRGAAFEEKRKDIFDAFFNTLKKNTKTTVNRDALQKLKVE